MERLEDLLSIDTDSNKANENKMLLTKIKQLLKKTEKKENNLNAKAGDLPYKAVSVVGKKLVHIKFSLETREAVVEKEESFTQDVYNNNMAVYYGLNKLKELGKHQKE